VKQLRSLSIRHLTEQLHFRLSPFPPAVASLAGLADPGFRSRAIGMAEQAF
jgi:hypothetical protein